MNSARISLIVFESVEQTLAIESRFTCYRFGILDNGNSDASYEDNIEVSIMFELVSFNNLLSRISITSD